MGKADFQSAWWLSNPHMQTLWPTLARNKPRPVCRRERLHTPDHDFVDVDWFGEAYPGRPIIMLCHGLTGSSTSPYIRGMQHALFSKGWVSAALNFRGCSGEANWTSRGYHSGDTVDLAFLFQTISGRHPACPIAVIGYSLGGSVVLNWLARSQPYGLSAAAAVSVPLELNRCADKLDTGFSRIYRNQLLKELKVYIQDKKLRLLNMGLVEEYHKLADLGDLRDVASFWAYDDRVVARLYGFKSAADYYQQSSARQHLSKISLPTLIIQSRDDPFMTPDSLPGTNELGSAVELQITNQGGHVGFITGKRPGITEYWLESRIPAFLAAYLPVMA